MAYLVPKLRKACNLSLTTNHYVIPLILVFTFYYEYFNHQKLIWISYILRIYYSRCHLIFVWNDFCFFKNHLSNITCHPSIFYYHLCKNSAPENTGSIFYSFHLTILGCLATFHAIPLIQSHNDKEVKKDDCKQSSLNSSW